LFFRYKEFIMKLFKSLFALLLLAAAMAGSSSAWADRYHGGFHGGPRVGVGVVIGGPYWGYRDPFFYPPYPYAYPPVVVTQDPPVYIEQGQAPAPQASNDWFYCRNPEGYYPYVKQCPGGWQRVAPQPPPQP
jgi:hypothetical protein